ncbi:uncharacterized protein LOC105846818 isoform X3 [Hydra vulgaris]|uniref:Uncharacterized protein LOC105846818 isoform X3 n=1 Tax=Hydra vulgaris TaxID=6087 RepID=A0ABM4BE93_HYDVU
MYIFYNIIDVITGADRESIFAGLHIRHLLLQIEHYAGIAFVDADQHFKFETIKLIESNNDRVAVVCYVPNSIREVHLFVSLLYGSWRHINDNLKSFESIYGIKNHIDLLVFSHPSVVDHLKVVCNEYNLNRNIFNNQGCYVIEQPFESNIDYGPINSFIMFNRTDIYFILESYKYTMRTDYDAFLSPALYFWKPKYNIMTGEGGYSVDFNRNRLKNISKKLGMKHAGIHNVGSTWLGETKVFITLAKKTLELTSYIYLNEFHPNLPGLEKLDLQNNIYGQWPTWWRPVSLLYGAELSLNHLVEDFSESHKGAMDVPSCSDKSIWETPHIHCWHNECEFQKFEFIKHLANIIDKTNTIPGEIAHRMMENLYEKDVTNMTIMQYSTYIAWNSVGKHLKKYFLED